MTNGLDLALGSYSIGTRVHSRRRVGNEACEAMASSKSSLDLSAKIEELWNAAVGEAPPPLGGDRFSRTGERSFVFPTTSSLGSLVLLIGFRILSWVRSLYTKVSSNRVSETRFLLWWLRFRRQ